MKIKGLKDEDYVNYKKPSMFIIFPYCSFKCDKENGCQLCQNSSLAHEPDIEISLGTLLDRYQNNPLTKAIVCGGLEPFDSIEDLLNLIQAARDFREIDDDIVIYTGYTEEELTKKHPWIYRVITSYKNIIIKYGRFRPNEESHYDEILGVKLVSSNQYAKKVN
jgi:organic radical activating enzyme